MLGLGHGPSHSSLQGGVGSSANRCRAEVISSRRTAQVLYFPFRLLLSFQTTRFRSGCTFSASESCVKDILMVFLDGETEAGDLGETAGLQKGSGAGLELNCASNKSFFPQGHQAA